MLFYPTAAAAFQSSYLIREKRYLVKVLHRVLQLRTHESQVLLRVDDDEVLEGEEHVREPVDENLPEKLAQ